MDWNLVESVDDLVSRKERKINSSLQNNASDKCPFLERLGSYFFFCGVNSKDFVLRFEPSNPVIKNRLCSAELGLYCLNKYSDCKKYLNLSEDV
ncbi:hypothetical protein K9L97_05635 [Candidatus Woesearchaeota archaeon]|nr:hypothetical protein [Candidatus Woesearchaeota archaeon]